MQPKQLSLVPEDVAPPSSAFVSEGPQEGWSPPTIVWLHMLLLDDLARLADKATPLEEKFELLRWVFTTPDRDAAPFSFANCIKLCGRSATPYHGLMSAAEVREAIEQFLPRWMAETLAAYPAWIQRLVRSDPELVMRRLEDNPQYLNEEAKKHGAMVGTGRLRLVVSNDAPVDDLFSMGERNETSYH